jgi:hypothetical protein
MATLQNMRTIGIVIKDGSGTPLALNLSAALCDLATFKITDSTGEATPVYNGADIIGTMKGRNQVGAGSLTVYLHSYDDSGTYTIMDIVKWSEAGAAAADCGKWLTDGATSTSGATFTENTVTVEVSYSGGTTVVHSAVALSIGDYDLSGEAGTVTVNLKRYGAVTYV